MKPNIFLEIIKEIFWDGRWIDSFLTNRKFKLEEPSIIEINTFLRKVLSKEEITPSPENKKIVRFVWLYNFLKFTRPGYRLSDVHHSFATDIVQEDNFFNLTNLIYPSIFEEIKKIAANTSFLSNMLLFEYTSSADFIYLSPLGNHNSLFRILTERGLEFNNKDYQKMQNFTHRLVKRWGQDRFDKFKIVFQDPDIFKYLVDRYEALPPEMHSLLNKEQGTNNRFYLQEKLRSLEKIEIGQVLTKTTINKKQKI